MTLVALPQDGVRTLSSWVRGRDGRRAGGAVA